MALCGLSGATTTTVPMSFITEMSMRIPGAVMPSSLVTRIKGFLEAMFCKELDGKTTELIIGGTHALD